MSGNYYYYGEVDEADNILLFTLDGVGRGSDATQSGMTGLPKAESNAVRRWNLGSYCTDGPDYSYGKFKEKTANQ